MEENVTSTAFRPLAPDFGLYLIKLRVARPYKVNSNDNVVSPMRSFLNLCLGGSTGFGKSHYEAGWTFSLRQCLNNKLRL